ncbi:MAG: type III-B CRISPR-associated protein Cas10/Cmr2 [Acetobacteraceae bacterium]
MNLPEFDPLEPLRRSIAPEALIHAWLHDPPDKALSIQGHQSRAARYLGAVLGEPVSVESVKGDAALSDQLAAIAERLPMPIAGPNGARAVGPEAGKLSLHHPLGGATREITVPPIDEGAIAQAVGNLCSGISDRRALFRLLWRCLPERLGTLNPAYAFLPADTRVPDHTVWNHADTTSALLSATGATGKGDHALLSFAISPVQSFIAAARSLRDLRNGSLILSWLAFRAMRPVLEYIGPTALIFPNLRGNALVDQWLRGNSGGLGSKIGQPQDITLLTPSLPNRFLALVPMGPDGSWAEGLARATEAAAADAWRELAESVRREIDGNLGAPFRNWDQRWETQILETWDFVVVALPLRELGTDAKLAEFHDKGTFAEAFPAAEAVRSLASAIPPHERPGYDQQSAGRWQASVDLAARFLQAARSVRRVPLAASFPGEVPEKCTLLGTWEQMGPGNRNAANDFWTHVAKKVAISGTRVRAGEKLCAVALVKRFAMAHLAAELGLRNRDDRFPDTATLAARLWLDKPEAADVKKASEEGSWNGQWLHWAKRDQEEDDCCPNRVWEAIRRAKQALGPPPAYYAVLMLDGDNMGDWLAGDKSPLVRTAMHPKLADYFEKLPGTANGLAERRPVAPSLHAAISEALGNFAQAVVPAIVERHSGTLIYAGGDDVLALLPTETALAAARDLDRAFRGDAAGNNGAPEGYYRLEDRDLLMMGPRASASAGVAVVHYKEDLRAALELARKAERNAKNCGRGALCLTIARRSGEHAGAALPWALVDDLASAVSAFQTASDRWAYRLRNLLPTFGEAGPPEAAFLSEITRQLERGDDAATRNLPVIRFYERLRAPHLPGAPESRAEEPWIKTAERVLILWQSASFLARGRDQAGRT